MTLLFAESAVPTHPLHLSRVHARKSRNSTKLGSNLYARVENDIDGHADAVYRYYETDLIRALYEYGEHEGRERLNILAFEIFTNGWEDSTYTKRRIVQFMWNNVTNHCAFTHQGIFYVLPQEHYRAYWSEDAKGLYNQTGKTRAERWAEYNLFNPETSTAFVPLSMPVIHPLNLPED